MFIWDLMAKSVIHFSPAKLSEWRLWEKTVGEEKQNEAGGIVFGHWAEK